jgi:hypothetical protein
MRLTQHFDLRIVGDPSEADLEGAPGCRVWGVDVGCRVYRVWGVGRRVQGAECGVWEVGCRV